MYRIPFRALGRPLSGKRGRFHQSQARVPAPVVEPVQAIEVTSAVEPGPVVEAVQAVEPEPVVEPEPAVDPMVDIDLSFSEAIEWKPSWTKTQLLAVAQEKGLSVTSSNTKAEIVAALTAAG